MEKLLKTVLTLTMILTLSACSKIPSSTAVENKYEAPSISANSDQDTSMTENQITSEDIADETTIEEQVIWEQDGLKVTVTGFNQNGFYGSELQLLIENSSPRNITVQARNCVVNGYMADITMSADVAAGKKANDCLRLNDNSLDLCGVDIITDIKFNLVYFNTDSWENIGTTGEISLQTNDAGSHIQEYDDSGYLAYEGNGIKMISKGIQADGAFGQDALFYFENNTDQNITIQCRDASANGFMVDPIFSLDICAGAKGVDEMTFSSSDLEKNGIERIENLEFKLFVFNAGTWETIFESGIIAFTPEYIC